MNSFKAPTPQSPQPARDNRSAAQRRYRKKEEDGFLRLREALKEVAKDDPRTRQDILRKGLPASLYRFSQSDGTLKLPVSLDAWRMKTIY